MFLADFPVGDPTVLGWATFILYLLAAWLSFRSAKTGRTEPEFARSWRVLALLLLLLGLNKQLDLQTSLFALGRRLATAAGIYEHRRSIQLAFFIGLMVGLIAVVIACFKTLAAFTARHRVCVTGFGLVCAYAFVRAALFDHVDAMLGFDLEKLPGIWGLEGGGVILIIADAGRQELRARS